MNRFGWLVKRELWENRSIVWGMPITAALLVVGSLFGLQFNSDLTFSGHVDADKQRQVATAIYFGFAMLFLVWAFFQMFFYSLDALYADRRDRSLLFWKSLPLSDAETVLAKAFTALVVVPAMAVATALVTQWGIALVGALKFGAAVTLDPQVLGAAAVATVYVAVIFALWYAPVVAYGLAWSAWAPKSPFLYAVLPPVVLSIAEQILFDTHYVGSLVRERLIGFLVHGLGAEQDGIFFGVQIRGDEIEAGGPGQLAGLAGGYFAEPGLWLGLVAAALLVFAAIKIRRYRDEAT